MEHNRNNDKIKLSPQLTLAIKKLRQLPNDSPCVCKNNMQKLLLLNEVTHCTLDYTMNFGNFAYDDCAGLHSQGEDIANEVIELIYLCIKSNVACEDPLRLKNEVSSMTWTEYYKKKTV